MDSERAFPIEEAEERLVDVRHPSKRIQIWFRTWGIETGIPVLFVHGGPGNCVDDYQNINKDFFDYNTFYVVEVDQRGTGNSLPSVRSCDMTEGVTYIFDLESFQMRIFVLMMERMSRNFFRFPLNF